MKESQGQKKKDMDGSKIRHSYNRKNKIKMRDKINKEDIVIYIKYNIIRKKRAVKFKCKKNVGVGARG